MAKSRELKMQFEMYDGNLLNLSLKNPKQDLTMTSCEAWARLVKDNDFLIRNDSTVLRLNDAYIYETEKVQLEP